MTQKPMPSEEEIDATIEAESELVKRFASSGAPEALGELMEKATGAKVRAIKVRRRSPNRKTAAG